MDHDNTGCQSAPEGPVLCVNNCGFFGSAATMNMCSKCHKDMLLKQEQTKLASSSIGGALNGSPAKTGAEPITTTTIHDIQIEPKTLAVEPLEEKPKEGPSRCTTCNKRVGLTGFKCRCGHLYCGSHRYSDKHNCPFDYRSAGRSAISKANPVIKAEKLDKI